LSSSFSVSRAIATPGSAKDAKSQNWTTKQYVTISIVAGVAVLTCVLGYRLIKQQGGVGAVFGTSTAKRDVL